MPATDESVEHALPPLGTGPVRHSGRRAFARAVLAFASSQLGVVADDLVVHAREFPVNNVAVTFL